MFSYDSFFYLQDDGILVVPTVPDAPLKLDSKKSISSEFQDRLLVLLSIVSMSGCSQVSKLGTYSRCYENQGYVYCYPLLCLLAIVFNYIFAIVFLYI